jgi:predicted acylesterase/phospholipase RssA
MATDARREGVSSQPRRALVLSGGGGRGAFECGVIEKLAELGWRPDVLVGTSIGAMNAAVLAIGGSEAVGAMWHELPRRRMHRLVRLPPWHSILDRPEWKKVLEDFAPQPKLDQVTKPLYIVTTNTKVGHPLIYTNAQIPPGKERLYQHVDGIQHTHILASSAIPYVYPKVTIEPPGGSGLGDSKIDHWDGAVMYNSPLQPAVHSGADQIMIVLLSPYHDQYDLNAALPSAPPGIQGKLGYLLDLAVTATFENDFEQMRRINRRVDEERAEPDHRKVKAALIGPRIWLPPHDILRYRAKRIGILREAGWQAAERTWADIQERGWPSLVG